jgi:hypothetical protein
VGLAAIHSRARLRWGAGLRTLMERMSWGTRGGRSRASRVQRPRRVPRARVWPVAKAPRARGSGVVKSLLQSCQHAVRRMSRAVVVGKLPGGRKVRLADGLSKELTIGSHALGEIQL